MSSRWVYPDKGIDGTNLEEWVMAGHKAAAEEEADSAIHSWTVTLVNGQIAHIQAASFRVIEGYLWLYADEDEEGVQAVFAPGWASIEYGMTWAKGPTALEAREVIPEAKRPDYSQFIKRSLDSKRW